MATGDAIISTLVNNVISTGRIVTPNGMCSYPVISPGKTFNSYPCSCFADYLSLSELGIAGNPFELPLLCNRKVLGNWQVPRTITFVLYDRLGQVSSVSPVESGVTLFSTFFWTV